MAPLAVYTDGSHRSDGGRTVSVWAYVVEGTDRRDCGLLKAKTASSSKAEQQAILKALEATQGEQEVNVYTDSRSSAAVIENWQVNGVRPRTVEAGRFLNAFLRATEGRKVSVHWVRAHEGLVGNEAVDRLARTAMRTTWVIGRLRHRTVYAAVARDERSIKGQPADRVRTILEPRLQSALA